MNFAKKIILIALAIILLTGTYAYLDKLTLFISDRLFTIPKVSRFGNALRFFIYEVPKVMILLTTIVFGVGIVRSYFSPERTRTILGDRKLFIGNVFVGYLFNMIF